MATKLNIDKILADTDNVDKYKQFLAQQELVDSKFDADADKYFAAFKANEATKAAVSGTAVGGRSGKPRAKSKPRAKLRAKSKSKTKR